MVVVVIVCGVSVLCCFLSALILGAMRIVSCTFNTSPCDRSLAKNIYFKHTLRAECGVRR